MARRSAEILKSNEEYLGKRRRGWRKGKDLMGGRQEQVRAAVARAICAACGEEPERPGDARGNAFRWQDYEQTAEAVVFELQAAEAGEPGRSAVPHLATIIALSCDDGPDLAWRYEHAAGNALRAYFAAR